MSKTFDFTPDGETRTVERLVPPGDYRALRKDKWGTLVLHVPHIVDVKEIWRHGKWETDEWLWDSVRPVPPTPPEPPGFFARLFRRNKLPVARVVNAD